MAGRWKNRPDGANFPDQAESVLARGQADIIAIGRQALADPKQAGWWLERRQRAMTSW